MAELKEVYPKNAYIVVPARYVVVYQHILILLANYGEEVLKDCKAGCNDKNNDIIECFNLFNAAIAAKHLGQDKKAETIIKYVEAKINKIFKNHNNSGTFSFPLNKSGSLIGTITYGDELKFWIPSEEDLDSDNEESNEDSEESNEDDENNN